MGIDTCSISTGGLADGNSEHAQLPAEPMLPLPERLGNQRSDAALTDRIRSFSCAGWAEHLLLYVRGEKQEVHDLSYPSQGNPRESVNIVVVTDSATAQGTCQTGLRKDTFGEPMNGNFPYGSRLNHSSESVPATSISIVARPVKPAVSSVCSALKTTLVLRFS